MMHVKALCLVLLSSLTLGYPTSDPVHNITGPTKIDLLSTEKPDITSPANGNIKRSYNNPALSNTDVVVSSKPVVYEGDRTRVESGRTRPALKYIQTFLVDVLQPQPIVDTIREEDKYGNEGEKLRGVGRSIVGGVTKLTNFISSAVDVPYDVLKSITRKATETLNNIGNKIVGI